MIKFKHISYISTKISIIEINPNQQAMAVAGGVSALIFSSADKISHISIQDQYPLRSVFGHQFGEHIGNYGDSLAIALGFITLGGLLIAYGQEQHNRPKILAGKAIQVAGFALTALANVIVETIHLSSLTPYPKHIILAQGIPDALVGFAAMLHTLLLLPALNAYLAHIDDMLPPSDL